MRLAAKRTGEGQPLTLSGGQASDVPFEGAGEAQFSDQLRRIGRCRKVIANTVCPPTGFGWNKRNEFPPLAGRHIPALASSDGNISRAKIKIDDRPEQKRFCRLPMGP